MDKDTQADVIRQLKAELLVASTLFFVAWADAYPEEMPTDAADTAEALIRGGVLRLLEGRGDDVVQDVYATIQRLLKEGVTV